MNLHQYKEKLFKDDPDFKKFYNSYDLAFEVGQMILEARIKKHITQKKLAEMMQTKQSSIARAESGSYLPSLSFLNKMASVLKTELFVHFKFLSSSEIVNKTHTISKVETYSARDYIYPLGKYTYANMQSSVHEKSYTYQSR